VYFGFVIKRMLNSYNLIALVAKDYVMRASVIMFDFPNDLSKIATKCLKLKAK
jgi:hypothetical protein